MNLLLFLLMIPCSFKTLDFCELSSWDALVVTLVAAVIISTIFFRIQGNNTKMLNIIWKDRFQHSLENTILPLLWIRDSCSRLHLGYENISNKPNPIQNLIDRLPLTQNKIFTRKLKEANKKTLSEIKDYVEIYFETITPQFEIILNQIIEKNNKIKVHDENISVNMTLLSEIIDLINESNKKYGVKKKGKAPDPIYEYNVLVKVTTGGKNIAFALFFIPGFLWLNFLTMKYPLTSIDILSDWMFYAAFFIMVLGITIKSKKPILQGVWFIFGGFVMLLLGIYVGLFL